MTILRFGLIFLLTAFLDTQVSLATGRERIAGNRTFIGNISRTAGFPLKIFVTQPERAAGKIPVIFQVGWLSCDTVEIRGGP
jgi:hypothetical protein